MIEEQGPASPGADCETNPISQVHMEVESIWGEMGYSMDRLSTVLL
jgi:hypothetical protein